MDYIGKKIFRKVNIYILSTFETQDHENKTIMKGKLPEKYDIFHSKFGKSYRI